MREGRAETGEGAGEGYERLDVRDGSDAQGRSDAWIHDDGGHPSIEESNSAAEAAAEIDIFAAIVGIANGKLGKAERSGKRHHGHAAPDRGEQCRRTQ